MEIDGKRESAAPGQDILGTLGIKIIPHSQTHKARLIVQIAD